MWLIIRLCSIIKRRRGRIRHCHTKFVPDPNFSIPGQNGTAFMVRIQNNEFWTQKLNVSSRKYDRGCVFRITDPRSDLFHFGSRIQVQKRSPDPQRCVSQILSILGPTGTDSRFNVLCWTRLFLTTESVRKFYYPGYLLQQKIWMT